MLRIGKQVGGHQYISREQYALLEPDAKGLVDRGLSVLAALGDPEFNVIRIDTAKGEVAFLWYPELGQVPFPSLNTSFRVGKGEAIVAKRSYRSSLNPPILHRTELLLNSQHPNREACVLLTQSCEELGLFDNSTTIGFQKQWHDAIQARGYRLEGFELLPIGNIEPESIDHAGSTTPTSIARFATALSRTTLSAPVQSLLRDELLTIEATFLDYGCGRGDDVAGLTAAGIASLGWDPHFRAEVEPVASDVVNIGFVINVIESKDERDLALDGAFSFTKKVLCVAAMLGSNEPTKGKAFADGVVTSRRTFQKYFSQAELRAYIEAVLGEEAYPAGPGIFYVFRDSDLEQQFLLRRSRGRSRLGGALQPYLVVARERHRAEHQSRRAVAGTRQRIAKPTPELSEESKRVLDELWGLLIDLGRMPAPEEIPESISVRAHFSSLKRAIEHCLEAHDPDAWESAGIHRRDDILVMLALRSFDRRRKFARLEPRLARDLRSFFGSYGAAQTEATKLLFSMQDVNLIKEACEAAALDGLGWLEPNESLQLHTSMIDRLGAVLRIYIGCATVMAGDISEFDLVKVHITSGKVTVLSYDDFEGKPVPKLMKRLKVRLRDQEMDLFEYGTTFQPTMLFRKSRYINEEFPMYAEQQAFEDALERAALFDLDAHGPNQGIFELTLEARRYRIDGFELSRSKQCPAIDAKCGAHYRYRDLVECGATWQAIKPDNTPQSADTYNAICDLAVHILDPVIEYFGAVELTYGFAGRALTRKIPRGIAPELDQHASCDIKAGGEPICDRLGAAVDFLVRDEDMREVMAWIAANCRFDRMYLYGVDRPLHVSFGPQNSGAIYEMVKTSSSRQVPRPINLDKKQSAARGPN
jgi:DNA phosphorothioation-associated putative methyltransferase